MFRHLPFFLLLCLAGNLPAQEVVITNYTTLPDGRVGVEVEGRAGRYYKLQVRHEPDGEISHTVSLTRGSNGPLTLSEGLAAYPETHYRVIERNISGPDDDDNDGVDDVSEWAQLPTRAPLNAAAPIDFEDGVVALDSFSTFQRMSFTRDRIQFSEFLNGRGHVKFIIADFFSPNPRLYFINSEKHSLHADFAQQVGINHLSEDVKRGQVIYYPNSISANGTLGTFAFNYSNGHGDDFEVVRKTNELLAANIPFLRNNLAYFITPRSEDEFARDRELYEDSRIGLLFEDDVFAEVDYWGLNQTEGYGFFRQISLQELPGPRDVVLYDALPNDLPRVAGIISSVVQTPLSHVNLRAIQNGLPNAFIRDPLAIDSIADLLGKPIYFKVMLDGYIIREASTTEVNDWFEGSRPAEEQVPPLNLTYREILPLTDITFDMADGFGAKCANVATMLSFNFPAGTTPEGFGIPFYYYQEFMKFNGFFAEARALMAEEAFMTDRDGREERLDEFRKRIRKAEMPEWMLDELADMHAHWPPEQSIRTRSSTNNEDLPGFNGAGLYTSKTQHPEEGHISKSIKQVYASLWNLRAFEEREYYRIDHFAASMGVLCHPNYEDENANGVGVSADPLYGTSGTFYLNSQLGEDLITNPENATIPEEVLLERRAGRRNPYIVVQRSSLTERGERVLADAYLEEMREYLSVIHDEFEILYDAEEEPSFAMDIEYKITAEGQLIIKQARPWVSFVKQNSDPEPDVELPPDGLLAFPNPSTSDVRLRIYNGAIDRFDLYDTLGRLHQSSAVPQEEVYPRSTRITKPGPGAYTLIGRNADGEVLSKTTLIFR